MILFLKKLVTTFTNLLDMFLIFVQLFQQILLNYLLLFVFLQMISMFLKNEWHHNQTKQHYTL